VKQGRSLLYLSSSLLFFSENLCEKNVLPPEIYFRNQSKTKWVTTPSRDKLQMLYPAEANHSLTNFQSFMKSSWYESSEPNQGQDSLKEPVIFMKSLAKNQQIGRRILDRFLNFLRTAVTCQNQILRYFENHGYISGPLI
jgi:hypothetical protein